MKETTHPGVTVYVLNLKRIILRNVTSDIWCGQVMVKEKNLNARKSVVMDGVNAESLLHPEVVK